MAAREVAESMGLANQNIRWTIKKYFI